MAVAVNDDVDDAGGDWWGVVGAENCCVCLKRLLRREVKGNDAAMRQELENAEMKVEQCKVNNCCWFVLNFYSSTAEISWSENFGYEKKAAVFTGYKTFSAVSSLLRAVAFFELFTFSTSLSAEGYL